MARFFKPLLSAVTLAAAALTSTGALAAYAYNAQISVTAPKGSAAEAASKDKTLPTGVKYTPCAATINTVTPNILNYDQFTITVKYDAGKAQGEIGDVYVVLQDLSETGVGAVRYYFIQRPAAAASEATTGVTIDQSGTTANNLEIANPRPFLRAAANLGNGAQTEVLFGNSIGLEGLNQGLWTASVIIAKPNTTVSSAILTPAALQPTLFSFTRPDTWAASDTVAFVVGAPTANTLSATCL